MVLLVDLEERTVDECVERDTGHTLLGNGRRIRRAATDQQDDGPCGKGGKLWWCSIFVRFCKTVEASFPITTI